MDAHWRYYIRQRNGHWLTSMDLPFQWHERNRICFMSRKDAGVILKKVHNNWNGAHIVREKA